MEITSGDTAWLLTSSALVLFMTPGLAFFYGGMVRAKNMLAMLMMNFVAMGIITIVWIAVGASLAFSGTGKFVGDLKLAGLMDVGLGNEIFTAYPIPDNVFLMFQLMFAIITPALIAGAVAAVVLLCVGGLFYTLGAAFYGFKWPNHWPDTFGYHEYFHACTVLAAVSHYIAIWLAMYA